MSLLLHNSSIGRRLTPITSFQLDPDKMLCYQNGIVCQIKSQRMRTSNLTIIREFVIYEMSVSPVYKASWHKQLQLSQEYVIISNVRESQHPSIQAALSDYALCWGYMVSQI